MPVNNDYCDFNMCMIALGELNKLKKIKKKYTPLDRANKWAKKNQKELEQTQELVKEFCERLGGI